MSKYVPDVSTHRWVIVSPHRSSRPEDEHKHHVCIFCNGHEKLTPAETFRIGEGKPNEPGWKVRVISNKFPITDFHEVIVHSPKHDKDIAELPVEKVQLIFEAYRQRYNFYQKNGQVIIFCNNGMHAGASLIHPHSQLVVIPGQINMDTLVKEPIQNTVFHNKSFIAYCPEFSQWPYEVWIVPRTEDTLFGEITDAEIIDLVTLMKRLVRSLEKVYEHADIFDKIDKQDHPFGYNYYIYPKKNWYLRIIPRFIHRAGFELGTGLSVNIVDPIEAAEELKK